MNNQLVRRLWQMHISSTLPLQALQGAVHYEQGYNWDSQHKTCKSLYIEPWLSGEERKAIIPARVKQPTNQRTILLSAERIHFRVYSSIIALNHCVYGTFMTHPWHCTWLGYGCQWQIIENQIQFKIQTLRQTKSRLHPLSNLHLLDYDTGTW